MPFSTQNIELIAAKKGVSVSRSSNLSFANAIELPVNWQTQDQDDGDWWDGGQPARFSITEDGWYSFAGGIISAAVTPNNYMQVLRIRKNNLDILCSNRIFTGTFAATDFSISVAGIDYLTNGDHIELFWEQHTGGPLNALATAGTYFRMIQH